MPAWYGSYSGLSVGRIFHFLHAYCGLSVAEHAEFKGNQVMYYGKHIADYKYSDKLGEDDVPEFVFHGPNALDWERNQVTKREEAIKDAFHGFNLEERRILSQDVSDVLRMTHEKMWRRANLSCQIAHPDKPLQFFMAKRNGTELLMFESFHVYYWHDKMSCWLRAS